ncbi:hypothetical protein LOK49_LG07G00783 [Camellia lanceoleosa]|uniref:Uncharacterized protein n=1 Tax=Camellia lanceoleosa TaxID=1840588 RepID=A0ACC0H4N8_9ERIC|nr:hypothetical protein LOK49_LG07G00783 [Camellia lanceoleosa]
MILEKMMGFLMIDMMGFFQISEKGRPVVGNTNVKAALSHARNGDDMKIVNRIEQNGNGKPIVDGDMEGKKISIGSKTDSYSVSKIWLWSEKGKFASSSETQ